MKGRRSHESSWQSWLNIEFMLTTHFLHNCTCGKLFKRSSQHPMESLFGSLLWYQMSNNTFPKSLTNARMVLYKRPIRKWKSRKSNNKSDYEEFWTQSPWGEDVNAISAICSTIYAVRIIRSSSRSSECTSACLKSPPLLNYLNYHPPVYQHSHGAAEINSCASCACSLIPHSYFQYLKTPQLLQKD